MFDTRATADWASRAHGTTWYARTTSAALGVRQKVCLVGQDLRGVDLRDLEVIVAAPSVGTRTGEGHVVAALVLQITLLALSADVVDDRIQLIQYLRICISSR